jgi:Tn3 transposase DDE domain
MRTGFSRHLEHAGGAEPRASDLLVHCHASILAQACNFGLTRMAQLADLSYRKLAWCTTWYLREETLKPAIASIVNRHYRHPLARLWALPDFWRVENRTTAAAAVSSMLA